jgi:cbb3-type cytochrome oxidase cytochrome c subunit
MRRMTLLPVLAGPAILLAAGYAATVVAPATATANTHRTAATRQYTKGAVKGREIYANNGCVACHTLQRRDTFTDAGLGGAPSGPDEALNDVPAMLGDARYGPDLSCVGDRVPGAAKGATHDEQVAAMVAYLQQPNAVHHGTTMPSYRFIRFNDLRRLAQYLVEHTCATGSTS